MNGDLKIIAEYLNGNMYLKDVEKITGLSEYKINLIIQTHKLPKLIAKTMTPAQQKRMQSSSSLANIEIQRIINEQLERERNVRITEEISQNVTIAPETFLNSRLVNTPRIYGCD